MIVAGKEHHQDPPKGIGSVDHNPFMLADIPNEGDGLEKPPVLGTLWPIILLLFLHVVCT